MAVEKYLLNNIDINKIIDIVKNKSYLDKNYKKFRNLV